MRVRQSLSGKTANRRHRAENGARRRERSESQTPEPTPEPSLNTLLAVLTSLLIVILAAAFAAPYVVDWNTYRSVFEAQASKLAGRPVRVAGDVDLTILPVPEVRFDQVSIADRSGSFDAPSASAEAFRMALSIPPLLRGKIEARKIELDQLSLRLGLTADGQVDWPRLGETTAALPFLPADVSLKSVTLNEASLAVGLAGGPVRWRIEGLTGELTAETLRGPFKFAGRALIGEGHRDLQVSVGRMSSQEQRPVKAVSRGEGAVYRVDGNLRALTEGPVFVGEVQATAPTAPGASPQSPHRWQATATGRATLDGASFDEVKVTITRNQRPQTLAGTAQLTWDEIPRLDAQLQSQWIDLDLLVGSDISDRAPAEVLLAIPSLLADVPIPASRARIEMEVTQISLGDDLIRDLRAVARRGEGGWGVEELRAGLPGSSSLRFDGQLAREGGAPTLAGAVSVGGTNLGRLLRWAAPNVVKASDVAAESFSLSGDVTSAPEAFDLKNISARLGDSRVRGAVTLAFAENRSGTVELNARTLDLRPYIEESSAALLRELFATLDDRVSPSEQNWTWRLALRADRLALPEIAATDVETRLRVDGQAVEIETLELRGDAGLRIAGSGVYPRDDAEAAPALRLGLSADRPEPLADLISVIPGGGAWLAPHRDRLTAMMPLHLSATMRPSRVEDSFWLRVDGTAGETELLVNARLYGADVDRYHLAVEANNPSLTALARLTAPDLAEWIKLESANRPARLRADFAKAGGSPWRGTADVTTDDLRLAYDGTVSPDAASIRFDGEAAIDAPDADALLALAGLPDPDASGAVALRATVSGDGEVYQTGDLKVDLDGQIARGHARLDVSGAIPTAEINLNAGRFHLARAAALLLEPRDETQDAAWPDTPFATEALKRVSGTLSLGADELVVSERLTVQDATMTARLEGGALRIPLLSGKVYDGEAVASAALRPATGRTVFEGEVSIKGLDLAKMPHGEGAPLATGTADLSLRAASEGLSPRGLTTVMSGQGQIDLKPGEIHGLDPRVVARVARDYLAAEAQPEETIAGQLTGPIRNSRFAHDGAQAALRLKDGALRLNDMVLDAPGDGQMVEANARLDIVEMTLNSQWDITAALDGEPMPRVRVTLSGPASKFGRFAPRIDADDLEQFLTVALMERNVERLEQLRGQGQASGLQGAQPDPAQESRPQRPPEAGTPSQPPLAPDDLPLESSDPLPGFSTEIESAPGASRGPEAATGRSAGQSNAGTPTPGAQLDDPDVVEDARREIMREAPAQPEPTYDPFSELFRN